MTPRQVHQLALKLGASIELFIRGRLKKPEILEEARWADCLTADAAPGADLARERQIARRLYWEFQLGLAGDWGQGVPPDCSEQGFCK